MHFASRNVMARVLGAGLVAASFASNVTHAQVTLFDNLDNVLFDTDWHTALGPDRRYAQQFMIGNSKNIDQVTVSLQRPTSGVTGSLRFELWRDSGEGRPIPIDDPTGKIADLGKLMAIEDNVPVGKFGQFELDNLILGLEPNTPYWLITDFAEVNGISGGERSVGFASVLGGDPDLPDPPGYDPTAGTNGAAHLHAYRNQDPFWADLNEVFGLEHFYQAMKVEAMEEPRSSPIPTLTKVGEPIWTVGDTHHFSGPADSDVTWQQTVDKVSPPSTHCDSRNLPHDNLWAQAIAESPFEEATTFVQSSIDAQPNGVFTVVRLLPDPGETGSSLDAESGPIIPVDLLPINATWSWSQDGETLASFSSRFFHPDCLVNGVDGLSSFQQISSIDSSFFPPGTEFVGSYATELQIRDSGGNGWDIEIPFEVVNEIAGDVHFNGVLNATDVDVLTSAVRQGLTDAKYDLNGDGNVNSDDRETWVHDALMANTYFGDSNLDGEFNSSDMVDVFAAGEYEDNITLNSTWADGDWNGDGDFDSSDLVTAFADGGYEQGPKAAVNAVPEPSALTLISACLVVVAFCRRRCSIQSH